MNPKVSVIIPCFNMGDYVNEAILSALNYPDQAMIEIIVVNDGSNDNGYTKNVLNAYLDIPNVTIINQENSGLGAARNNGIKAAKAEYIIPLDADNKLRESYITKGVNILDQFPDVAIVYGDNRQFGLNNRDVIVGEFDIAKLLAKNYIDACVVLRKSSWEAINGYDEQMPVMGYEDWDLNLRVFFKGWEFYYINEIVFDYRVRENSMLINSNNNKQLLLDYMFNKPELLQAKSLRENVIGHFNNEEELRRLKKRKIISFALKVEKIVKSIMALFR